MNTAKCACGRDYSIGYYDHGKCPKCLSAVVAVTLQAELDEICRKLDMLVDVVEYQDKRDIADELIDALELVLNAKKLEEEYEPDEH